MKNLTEKEIRFVEEYVLNGYVGSRAYALAYSTDNKNLAKAEAWSLLRKPHIQEAISASEKSCRQIAREMSLDRKSILYELKKIIKGDYTAKDRLAGINTFCKLTGGFSPDKSEVDIYFEKKEKIDTSNMSSEQIRELQNAIFAELT